MRLPWVIGALLLVLGAAGLVRGELPQATASGGVTSNTAPIVVTGAYVRPPAPPTDLAAAYFTVYNTTSVPDTLESVTTGAGGTAVVHALVDGVMSAISGGVDIPAHGSFVLSATTGHVMISDLFGPLQPGQDVNVELSFAHAGVVTVSAPVIALGQPAPTDAGAPSPSTTGASK